MNKLTVTFVSKTRNQHTCGTRICQISGQQKSPCKQFEQQTGRWGFSISTPWLYLDLILVPILSHINECPRIKNWEGVTRTIRYLKTTVNLKVAYYIILKKLSWGHIMILTGLMILLKESDIGKSLHISKQRAPMDIQNFAILYRHVLARVRLCGHPGDHLAAWLLNELNLEQQLPVMLLENNQLSTKVNHKLGHQSEKNQPKRHCIKKLLQQLSASEKSFRQPETSSNCWNDFSFSFEN